MVDLARPASLLEQATRHFAAQGWSATDLALFRMADDGDVDGDGDGDAGDADGEGGDKPLTPEERVRMEKALKKANKEAETARLKLKEIEDRDKSETEKLTERTRELEGNLTSAQATALRYEIALDKGVPKTIASRLQGSTREEMEADADELLKTLGGGNGKKTPSFDGGAKDDKAPEGGSFLAKALRDKRSA